MMMKESSGLHILEVNTSPYLGIRKAGLAKSRHVQTSPSNILQASYRWQNLIWSLESELLTTSNVDSLCYIV